MSATLENLSLAPWSEWKPEEYLSEYLARSWPTKSLP